MTLQQQPNTRSPGALMLGILKLLAASERGIAMRTIVSAWDVSLKRRGRAPDWRNEAGGAHASMRAFLGHAELGGFQVQSGLCCGLEGA
jgi:hypothetical protein